MMPAPTARAEGEAVFLTVADCGPGGPEEVLPQLGGVGLGLSIVKSCAEACQGKVTFQNRQPAGFQADIQLKSGN